MRPALTEATSPAAAPHSPASPMVTSAELLRGGRRLLIAHDGEVYTLQLTRQNKLLLTK
jgi:hemin uptake protein HemP